MSTGASTRVHREKLRAHKDKFKLILTKEFINDVNYLHQRTKNIEWSGLLVFKVEEGSLSEISKMIIKVSKILFMDIGTSGYTEYEFKADDDYLMNGMADAMLNGYKIGHIHTHHNMNTFFSGTDMDELYDNAPKHNWYLSLIVNFEDPSKWIAKIAQISEESYTGSYTVTKKYLGDAGQVSIQQPVELNQNDTFLNTWDADVVVEKDFIPVSSELITRYDTIKAEKDSKKSTFSAELGFTKSSVNGGQLGMFFTPIKGEKREEKKLDKKLLKIKNSITEAKVRQFTLKLLSNSWDEFSFRDTYVISPTAKAIATQQEGKETDYISEILFDFEDKVCKFFKLDPDMDRKELELYFHFIVEKMIDVLSYCMELKLIQELAFDLNMSFIIPESLLDYDTYINETI